MGPYIGPGPDSPAAITLRDAGAALYGPSWQTVLAEALEPHHPRRSKVDSAVVRGWAAGRRTVPAWVWTAIEEIGSDRRSEIGIAMMRVRAMVETGGQNY